MYLEISKPFFILTQGFDTLRGNRMVWTDKNYRRDNQLTLVNRNQTKNFSLGTRKFSSGLFAVM